MSGSLRSLFYHRICDPLADQANLAPDLISVTPRAFELQVQYLAHAYHPVSAEEVLAALNAPHKLPARAVLITVDDGYRDFLDVAWPILKRYRVPCVLFVSTAFATDPERLFWWDAVWQALARTDAITAPGPEGFPLTLSTFEDRRAAWRAITRSFKRLSPQQRQASVWRLADGLGVTPKSSRHILSWSELRSLAADGVAMGGHTRTHELLDQIDGDLLRSEVHGCRDDLAREIGYVPPVFAYPNGNFSSTTQQALQSAGYQLGFTTLPGLNENWWQSPLGIRRDSHSTSMLRFAVRLVGPIARRRARRSLRISE